jgi:hypothetical protein
LTDQKSLAIGNGVERAVTILDHRTITFEFGTVYTMTQARLIHALSGDSPVQDPDAAAILDLADVPRA